MDLFTTFLPIVIGLLSGMAGYCITTFWMKPLLRYLELRSRVLSDVLFYANVVNVEGMNEEMHDRHLARGIAFRRHSADLQASDMELPAWYRWYLAWQKRDLRRAAQLLMGLSNTTNYDQAQKRTSSILLLLGFTGEVTEML